jgi:hypothetical protein
MVRTGNATDCLRPWAVADKWKENVKCVGPNNKCEWVDNSTNPWTTEDTFDRWAKGNPPKLNSEITDKGLTLDEYSAPTETDPGTGFGLYDANGNIKDLGQPLRLKLGSNSDSTVPSGWFLSVDLSALCTAPGCPTNQGSDVYRFAIQNCVGGTVGIGDTLPVETGNMVGPTEQGVYKSTGQQPLSLYQRDPDAYWNPTTKTIENSCVTGGNCPGGFTYPYSPRIVPVALFDVDAYLAAGFTGSNGSVTVTNFFGFFVISKAEAEALQIDTSGNQNGTVYGVMVTVPGLTRSNTITTTSSFLREIVLVR